MKNFNYLIDKIYNANFLSEPFKFIYLENFFKEEHFNEIINARQIDTPDFKNSEQLINELIHQYKYYPQQFPGCVTDVNQYLKWIGTRQIQKGIKENQELLEGFGLALRLKDYQSTILKELIDFFNSTEFHNCLKEKFEKTDFTTVETAIQKYLTGYEISPHPDIRRKCLTYMININPSDQSEKTNLHTYFMSLNEDKKWIYDYWKNNTNVDRCWIPWKWAKPVFNQRKNNSITIFAPDNNTIHAVKLDYDHCKFQRTQFYGNLWYSKYNFIHSNWKKLEKIELQQS